VSSSNRILLPMINEAFFVLAEGDASATELDEGMTLAQLRRFEYFRTPKWLRLLRPTPKGRHYSGISGTGPAVILGGG
jgi:hypothetical protein